MDDKSTNIKNSEKLGINPDPLSLDDWLEVKAKYSKKLIPNKNIYGYPVQENRNGRPYYYLVWYVYVNGKRKRKKKYIGTDLPKGMRIGQSVNIS